jgi:hypothetical protein
MKDRLQVSRSTWGSEKEGFGADLHRNRRHPAANRHRAGGETVLAYRECLTRFEMELKFFA